MGLQDRVLRVARDGARQEQERSARMRSDVAHYRRRLLDQIDLAVLAPLDESQRRARLERMLGFLLSTEGRVMASGERSELIRRVVDESLGLGVLEPLLADQSVTEIMVNGPDEVFVERAGRVERVDVRFENEAQLYHAIDRIVSVVNRRVDESSPMVDARLPSGERVNVIVPPLSLVGPTVTIRRFPRAYPLAQLVAGGSLTPEMAELLHALVAARVSLVVSGGTGSGKTTLLNALSAAIPEGERVVTIEQTAELQLAKQHVVRLESRPPNVEGNGEVTISDLVRNSLRMRPDRIIVGEVRGGETLDMLQAMNTGHEGSLTTVHANTADDALLRLVTLASMNELALPFETLQEQITSAVDVIVHVERSADGARRVVEIAFLESGRRQAFRLVTVASFEHEPLGADLVVRGRHRHHALPPALAHRLLLAGRPVPAAFAPGSGDPAPQREAR